jgi:hypothetical protein
MVLTLPYFGRLRRTSSLTVQQDGTYNGWAIATINGVYRQNVIRDDYTHETFVPSSAVFDYSLLTGPDPLQYARFSGMQDYDRLEIYTPVTQYASNQEFLEVSSAPEPSFFPPLAVLGITLIAARSWGRWRWRAARVCSRLKRQSR